MIVCLEFRARKCFSTGKLFPQNNAFRFCELFNSYNTSLQGRIKTIRQTRSCSKWRHVRIRNKEWGEIQTSSIFIFHMLLLLELTGHFIYFLLSNKKHQKIPFTWNFVQKQNKTGKCKETKEGNSIFRKEDFVQKFFSDNPKDKAK